MENNGILMLNEQMAVVPTKSEIAEASAKLVERVEEGDMNALLAFGQLTALEETIKAAKERVKSLALEEAERYEGNGRLGFGAYGCEFQVTEAGVKYDYSENEYWRKLKEQVDLANAELKGHETMLKKLGQCAKSSTTIVKVTLKK